MKSIEQEVSGLIQPIDPIKAGLSQFTIDWIEKLECACESEVLEPESINQAFSYHVDTLVEVLKYGADRDFFKMIATYTDMWITSNPQQQRQKQTEARKRQETVRMATIEYNSTMTRERVMRKHNKDSMAGLLFKIWHEINEIRDNEKLSEERQKKLDEIQNRIAWG